MWHDFSNLVESQRVAKRAKRTDEPWISPPIHQATQPAIGIPSIPHALPISTQKKELRDNLVRYLKDRLKSETRDALQAPENEWSPEGTEPVIHPLALAVRRFVKLTEYSG